VQNASATLPASILGRADTVTGKLFRVLAATLLLSAASWLSIPTVPIPITLQVYAVTIVGALLGARLGTAAVLAWLAEAAVGLPVLAHGASGLAHFAGPTAGYLASFPIVAAFVGWLSDRKIDRGMAPSFLSMLAGNAINLSLGVAWLSIALGWHKAFLAGFSPFWLEGVAQAFLAAATVFAVRKARRPLPGE
jgi:biotin transport system substrate-specific component